MAKARIKRTGDPGPYAPWADRCIYAVETMRSVNATADEQIIELELMMMESDDEEFLRWHESQMAKITEARLAVKHRNELLKAEYRTHN